MKNQRIQLAAAGLAGVLCVAGLATARAQDGTRQQDKEFVMKSGEGSLAEVQMGKLAVKNSPDPEVRKFGEKMIHDHTMLIEKMKPFAQRMGVPPPTVGALPEEEKEAYQRLASEHGVEFDKDYIHTMVQDHHKDLGEFKEEYASTQNPAFKKTVGEGTEVIKQHTEIIDRIAQRHNIPAPAIP